MRLTGIPEITTRAFRATGVSTTEKLTPSAASKAPDGEGGIGIASTLGDADRSAPIDNDRVAEIRKAIKEGRYPLVPAQIADAMIAAKLYGTIEA